jgi:hypothetical protein
VRTATDTVGTHRAYVQSNPVMITVMITMGTRRYLAAPCRPQRGGSEQKRRFFAHRVGDRDRSAIPHSLPGLLEHPQVWTRADNCIRTSELAGIKRKLAVTYAACDAWSAGYRWSVVRCLRRAIVKILVEVAGEGPDSLVIWPTGLLSSLNPLHVNRAGHTVSIVLPVRAGC